MSEAANHKARTRQRILEEAAQIMRVVGTEGIGVAALMKRVGLTHGGFYAHFASRDELVANVLEQMFSETRDNLRQALLGVPEERQLAALIDIYLSSEACQHPEHSCPLPGLIGEARRLPAIARESFDRGMQQMSAFVTALLQRQGITPAENVADGLLAEMIGGVVLARAVPDEQRATQMLQNIRVAIKERLGLN